MVRVFGDDVPRPPPPRTGRIERLAPRPSAFVASREVQVWLPPGDTSEAPQRYPVLYRHDGQNLFDKLGAGADAEWQVDETAQRRVLATAAGRTVRRPQSAAPRWAGWCRCGC